MILLFLTILSCKSKNIIDNDINLKKTFNELSIEEIQNILQKGIETNHLDSYFTEDEKKEGVIVVINDFINPYASKINLLKFNEKVHFKTHEQIYNDLNEKFIDITLGYEEKNRLMINFGIRGKFNAMFVKYDLENGAWVKTTKNFNEGSENLSTVNFRNDKENCLAHAILKKKYPKKYYYLNKCNQYNFGIEN